jgi:hypothetical protein
LFFVAAEVALCLSQRARGEATGREFLEGGAGILKRRVVVTGLGLVTPVGLTVESTWAALMAGQSGVGYIEKFDTEKFSVKIAAEIKEFDPLKFVEKKEARKMGAFIHYAIAASDEAIYDSGLVERGQKLSGDVAERVGTYISSGIGDFWAIEREHSKLLEEGPHRVSPFFIPSGHRQLGRRSGFDPLRRDRVHFGDGDRVLGGRPRHRRQPQDHPARRRRRDDLRRRRIGHYTDERCRFRGDARDVHPQR